MKHPTDKYVKTERAYGFGDWRTCLVVGHQSFEIAASRGDKRQAQWFARELQVALRKMAEEIR